MHIAETRRRGKDLGLTIMSDSMTRHRDGHADTGGLDTRIDAGEGLGSRLCLVSTAVQAVLKIEQRLPDRITERDFGVVDKGHLLNPPSQQAACHIASQCPGSQDQALGPGHFFQVQAGNQSPPHELEVQIDCTLSQTFGIQDMAHVHRPRSRLPGLVLLPSNGLNDVRYLTAGFIDRQIKYETGAGIVSLHPVRE